MIEKTLALTAILLFDLIISIPVYAQNMSNNSHSSNIKLTHLTTNDGLSQNDVMAILQDRKGFMWFATRDGLNRYDGNTFVVYKNNSDDPTSISSNIIYDLIEDNQGYLWAGTSSGVNKFDPLTEQFTRYQNDSKNPNSISSNAIETIMQDHHGFLWFGATSGGLNKFDPVTNTFTAYRKDSQGKLITRITDVIEDSQGDIWFVGEQGLFHLNPITEKITRPSATIDKFSADYIHEDNTGNLWMLSWAPAALIKYSPETDQLTEYPLEALSLYIANLLDDGQHGFWVPSNQGLFHFDRDKERFTLFFQHDDTNPHSLNDNGVTSIFQDNTGLLWLGTVNGGINLVNFTQQQFGLYQRQPSNPDSILPGRVFEVHAESNDIIWLGLWPRGLSRLDKKNGNATNYLPENDSKNSISEGLNVSSILKDSRGNLWVGGWAEGLDKLDERTGLFTHYKHDPNNPNSLISNVVLEIFEGMDGILWLGQYGGLSRFDPETEQFTHFQPDPDNPTSLAAQNIRHIYRDSSGSLWIGSWDGILSQFDEKTETFINYIPDAHDPQKLNGGIILTIHEDQTHTLWIGAADGLYRFNREMQTFTRYTENQGLPSSNIHGILEDSAGRLWISTRKGLARFNIQTDSFRSYDVADGLQSNDFSESAYAQTPDGQLIFGGSKGINAFFPEKIQSNPYVPPVVITDLKIFNKPVHVSADSVLKQAISYTETLTLSYQDAIFSFEFAALSYVNSEKNKYRYILEGFESDWNEVDSKQRLAIYTNLDPGRYVFRVQASNNDGIWNEEGATLSITITPPWWKTWWFRVLISLLLVVLFISVYRLRVRALHKRTAEIEYLAYHDPLTLLPNRRLFLNRLEQALSTAQRSQHQGALLFIDLDNFKTLNDTRGHDTGDQLLIEVARRLLTCVRKEDTIARFGGDEFMIMLNDLGDDPNSITDKINSVTKKILATIGQPYNIAGYTLHITPSLGITMFIGTQTSPQELLKQADIAMYQAKSDGRNMMRYFDPEMQASIAEYASLEAALRRGIEDKQFILHYQAQVDSKRGIIGAEILLRWNHPERGLVPPDEFIPLAEESGLILPIGQWVLESACKQLKIWSNNPSTSALKLAINVSQYQFRQCDFIGSVRETLERTGAPPKHLKIELTESLLIEDMEDSINKMHAIRALGVEFSLDDFGTGYSSLSYLTRLPLQQLKIDRSFVSKLPDNHNDEVIAQTIITMAQSLQLSVIAEGVETEAQRLFLEQHGCTTYQGYLFSRPVTLSEFEALLPRLE